MEDASEFFAQYRPRLLTHLDATLERSDRSGPLDFVDEVLDNWAFFTTGRQLAEPSPQERTFWFALYQLETLAEVPPSRHPAPYEGFLLGSLAEARDRLREGAALPDGFFASRPGE